MAVANSTIIEKMINELKEAKEKSDQQKVVNHIANVRLLCDLFLEEDSAVKKEPELNITKEEMKAMIGEQKSVTKTHSGSSIMQDDANGDSIFDF
ncbi:YwdI family protein [Virgibacillus sp. C22-A2]|uniref:YwdI family protein n=1 Tax=Virgibacillus tibetensis TaxID=3042313 RepID=A0ABU6KHU8_9BACI|nr:YwdI family protein [Virgibacillus sp. C22-A2]